MRIVFVHSSGLGPRQWSRLRKLLDQPTIQPALLGYDDQPLPAQVSWQDDLRILEELIQPTDIVFGHSYGGFLALQLALRVPVAGLLIHEPAAIGAIEDSDFTLSGFFDLPPGGHAEWVPRLVAWWNGPGAWGNLNERARAPFLERATKVFAEVQSISQDQTPPHAYASIQAPAIISWGGLSRPEAVQMASRIATAMPHAESRCIEDVGHMAPVTHPNLFVPLLEILQAKVGVTNLGD